MVVFQGADVDGVGAHNFPAVWPRANAFSFLYFFVSSFIEI